MDSDALTRHADDACEAVRALNHLTMRTMPAPAAYELLGRLQSLGYRLPQLLEQISAGLSRSLTEYDVYDQNRAPAVSVAMANEAMRLAAEQAKRFGDLTAAAQLAINLQGYAEGSAHQSEEDNR